MSGRIDNVIMIVPRPAGHPGYVSAAKIISGGPHPTLATEEMRPLTDFDCIFDYLKEEGRVPKLLIVFTDGYPFGSWGDEDYCDTTWIIHGDPNPNPPFGTFALYEDHKNKARAA